MEISSEEKKVVKWKEKRRAKAYRIGNVLKSMSQEIHNNPIILDVGCHEGDMDQFFAKFTNNLLIGIDISFNSLKIAISNSKKEGLGNIEYVQADASALPFRSEKIDWLISNHVVDYIDEKESIFSEFLRIINKNGLIYLAVMSNQFLKLYKLFPFIFVPILGPFYGRSYPSYESKYGTPKSHKFWIDMTEKKFNLDTIDITTFLMSKNSDFQHLVRIKKSQNLLRRFLSKISPSWVFIIQKKS